jgi:Na+/H+-dicarboxylate symporter
MKANRLSGFILAAMFMGVVAGYIFNATAPTPEAAKNIASNLNLITTVFLRLIKMVIAPLVFCGLIVGLAAMGDARSVGRAGAKALAWFFGASLVSLSMGLILANNLQLGHAMNLQLPAPAMGPA